MSAILTFIKFMQAQNPQEFKNDLPPEEMLDDVAALRLMLPLQDVELIIRSLSCDKIESKSGDATFFAVELNNPEEFNTKLKSIVAELVHRLMSNMFAFAAKRELVDVAFDDDEGFVFSLTEKAKQIYESRHKEEDKTDEADDD